MTYLSWKRAGAIVAILATWTLAAGGADVAALKESAVLSALEKQGKGTDNAALLEQAASAAAITSVEMSGHEGVPEVIITTDGEPEYKWFTLDSGKRIVIDFQNTVHLQSGQRLAPIGAAPLERVRSSLFSLEPSLTSRIVIDLRTGTAPEFVREDSRLIVRIGSADTDAGLPEEGDLTAEFDRVAARLAQADLSIAAARERVSNEIKSRALPVEESTSDEIKAFVSNANESCNAAGVEFEALANDTMKPLDTQRVRFDELRVAYDAKTIAADKAKTTIESIDAEVKNAVSSAEQSLTAFETAFVRGCEDRDEEFQSLLAQANTQAPQPKPMVVAEAASKEEPIVEAASVESPVVSEPEPVKTAIEKIEQDLASIAMDTAAPIPAQEPATVVEEKPIPSVLLARLDGLNDDMAHLSQQIAAVAAAPDEEIAATESVPLDAVKASNSDAVNAAVTVPSEGAMMLAQNEASPEAEVVEAATEEVAEAEPTEETEAPADEATVADASASESVPSESEVQEVAEEPAVPASPATEAVIYEAPKSQPMAPPTVIATSTPAEREELPAGMDPLDQPVNIDFREMDLSSVISLLAKKAQVNVIAGTEVTGTVTADIRNVPLRKAMDMVLRMNGLGIVEEEGIFRIVPYEEAVAARRITRMVALDNAQAEDVRTTLEGILVGARDARLVSISANKNTNVIIISGPEESVADFERLARELDVKEPTLPTVTEALKLNYLDPKMAKPILDTIKTDKIGKVEIDQEGRHIIVTDVPAAVEQMRALLVDVDLPVKQVAIEAMIVDAVLRDASQTGVDWTIEAIRRHSSNGDLVSDLSELSMNGNLGNIGSNALDAGILSLGILSSEVRINAAIAAEAQSRNAEILANPSIVTVENNPATISIVQEFPYQEITQGLTGPPVASTEFKPIGVTLEVVPRVTHANDTIVELTAKQSSVSGLTETGVPIEDKREATTKLRAENGRTIFIGGLRNVSDRLNVSKIPVLGDIPVLSVLFRNTDSEKINTELLIFLTCHVINESLPELSATQSEAYDKLDSTPKVPDAQRANFRDILRPQEMRDPMWKWRRSNR